MNISKDEARADPPVKMGDSIQSRCEEHPESHGQNYKAHLKERHRPEVEA